MFMQSAAMALGFGSFFQYGKRKISSMSNEEFNALTPEDLTSQLLSNVNNMIPSVEQSFQQMERLNVLILDAMAKYFNQGVQKLEQWLQAGAGQAGHGVEHVIGAAGDFLEGAFDINTYLPSASADSGLVDNQDTFTQTNLKQNAIERYASKWITPPSHANFNNIKANEAKYLLYQMSKGNLPNHKFARTALLKKWELLTKTPTIAEQTVITKTAIDKSSTGIVRIIATHYNLLKSLISSWKRGARTMSPSVKNKTENKFRLAVSTFNKYVQRNGKRGLSIDAEKSLLRFKLIPRYT